MLRVINRHKGPQFAVVGVGTVTEERKVRVETQQGVVAQAGNGVVVLWLRRWMMSLAWHTAVDRKRIGG